MIRKLPDWDTRLRKHLKAMQAVPFSWGSNSCTHFTAGCIQAMTGVYPIKDILSSFDSKKEAIHCLRNVFHGNLSEAVSAICTQYGFVEVKTRYAQRGDLVIMDVEEINSLLICNGTLAVGPCEVGSRYLPMSRAKQTWRIPLMSF